MTKYLFDRIFTLGEADAVTRHRLAPACVDPRLQRGRCRTSDDDARHPHELAFSCLYNLSMY